MVMHVTNPIEKQKKEVLASWGDAIYPYTVNDVLYRRKEGMEEQMKIEIRQLREEGYLRRIILSGPAIGLDHSSERMFMDDFKGGNYYFFAHEIVQVKMLLSTQIKSGILIESRNRVSLKRCLVNAGFDNEEATDIISMRLKMDNGLISISFTDIRRKPQ